MLTHHFYFQEFDDFRDADDAVFELNNKELLGSRIVLDHAKPNRSGYGGGGGGRYGRGGGSRYALPLRKSPSCNKLQA